MVVAVRILAPPVEGMHPGAGVGSPPVGDTHPVGDTRPVGGTHPGAGHPDMHPGAGQDSPPEAEWGRQKPEIGLPVQQDLLSPGMK